MAARISDDYIWNRPVETWTAERAAKEYPYVEKTTGRRYKKVPLHAPGVRKGETGQSWRGLNPPPGKHWQFQPKTLDDMEARGEIYWSPNGNPRRKIYLDESDGVPIQDIWLDMRDAHNQNIAITGYPTEKNHSILARLIAASSNQDDWVLDCFAGSGTTLEVVAQLGRRWIGIDNSVEAIATILRRFAHGRERMGDFVSQRITSNELEANQLSLFKASERNEPSDSAKQKSVINNFSLSASNPYAGELDELLAHWQAWQSS